MPKLLFEVWKRELSTASLLAPGFSSNSRNPACLCSFVGQEETEAVLSPIQLQIAGTGVGAVGSHYWNGCEVRLTAAWQQGGFYYLLMSSLSRMPPAREIAVFQRPGSWLRHCFLSNFCLKALNSSRHLWEQPCPGTGHLTLLDRVHSHIVSLFSWANTEEGTWYEECKSTELAIYLSMITEVWASQNPPPNRSHTTVKLRDYIKTEGRLKELHPNGSTSVLLAALWLEAVPRGRPCSRLSWLWLTLGMQSKLPSCSSWASLQGMCHLKENSEWGGAEPHPRSH